MPRYSVLTRAFGRSSVLKSTAIRLLDKAVLPFVSFFSPPKARRISLLTATSEWPQRGKVRLRQENRRNSLFSRGQLWLNDL
jgi:hypothetical protein